MKIAVLCDSLLLQRSLQVFLKDYICTYKNSDIVISDKPISTDKISVLVGMSDSADIKIPFTRDSLFEDLKKAVNSKNIKKVKNRVSKVRNISDLEEKIDKITAEYKQKIMQAVKEFYG